MATPEPAEAAAAAACGHQKDAQTVARHAEALHPAKHAALLTPGREDQQADQHAAAAESPAADLGRSREVLRLLLLWLQHPSARRLQPHATWLQSTPTSFSHCWLRFPSTSQAPTQVTSEWTGAAGSKDPTANVSMPASRCHAVPRCMAHTIP